MVGANRTQDRELFYWLALRLTPGVGPIRFAKLLERFKAPEAVFQAPASELARFPRLPPKTVEALTRFDWGRQVEEELEKVRRGGFKLITRQDKSYPSRLAQIPDPPPVLWTAGGLDPSDAPAVALVGARGATDYGRETAGRLAADLAAAGICIVSGLALGIDAAAHRGALAAGGRTIGVLGCGLDVVYPRPNRDLYQKIPGSGALISEFPLGTLPQPANFPVRNRIIAGLSLAVVVVEAAEKSGALITARLALEQNRDVLAVPGRVGSLKSRGTHALLRQGARLVETARDVLEEIAPQLDNTARPKPQPPQPPPDMTPRERLVWDIITQEPAHVDLIGRKTGLAPAQLAPLLLELELKGCVRQLPGLRYVRSIS